MAVDQARAWTDKQLAEMEKRLVEIYNEAQAGIVAKWNKYIINAGKRLTRLQKAYEEALQDGDKQKIRQAKKKLEDAKKNITFRSKYYADMVDETTSRLAETNQLAIDYLNGKIPAVYIRNYNQAAKSADAVGIKFNLINEDVLRQRITEGDIKTPYMHLQKYLDIPKDKRWNTRQLNSSVLQGILQGEDMKKIAKRILPIVDNNRNAAIRNARTMVTGAENKGRLDSYKRLEEDGAVMKKVWIATPDGRTRESHLAIDGEEVDVNDTFSNDLEYPGDPDGDPAEVYNCRCTMITHITGFRKADGRVVHIDYDPEPTMHDRQMEEEKDRRGNG